MSSDNRDGSPLGYDPMDVSLGTQYEQPQTPLDPDGIEMEMGDMLLPASPVHQDVQDLVDLVQISHPSPPNLELGLDAAQPNTDIFSGPPAPVVDGEKCTEEDHVSIKEEETSEFVWENRSNETINISDDEAEPPRGMPSASQKLVVSVSAIEKTPPLDEQNPRTPMTSEQRAQFLEIQKILAARSTGRPVAVGAGGIFDSVHAVTKTNEHGWMEHQLSDSDEDRAEAFRKLNKAYRLKTKKGTNNIRDDIAFMRAKKAESMRRKKAQKEEVLEKAQEQQEITAFFGDEEGMFVSQIEPQNASSKRPHEDSEEEDLNVSDPEEADFLRQQQFNAKLDPNKRRHHGTSKPTGRDPVTAKDTAASMREGIAIALEKDKKKVARKARARNSKPTDPNKPRKVRKSKNSKSKDGENAEPIAKGKKKRYMGPSMTNMASLVGRNVIADAQANAGKGVQPTFTSHRKDKALKELIASIPEGNQTIQQTDKNALLKATKRFTGAGAMKADGEGGWKLKGMKTSLYHYQLLGAAFMRDRENGQDKPLGGILADDMGFGKTVMTIACMVDGRPLPGDRVRTTLIVATSALATQWMREIEFHTEENVFDEVLRHSAGSRIRSNNVVKSMQKCDVVVTTFSEVLRSYPKYDPPEELVTENQKQAWWETHFEKYKGPLHRVMWQRVVIDEAQLIKNHESKTAVACRGLIARHRWLISATPIQNDIAEFYSYFSLLKVKFTGSFDIFKKNFCLKGSSVAMNRLQGLLSAFMCRRTHLDTMFGLPLLTLPPSEQRTTYVEFNDLERNVYDIVRARFVERINGFSEQGVLESKYRHIFTMLLRLRQLTGHILTIQETMEDLLEDEDIEKLMMLTTTDVEEGSPSGSTILQLRKLLSSTKRRSSASIVNNSDNFANGSILQDDLGTGGNFGAYSANFQKYLRTLRDDSNWSELNNQTSCRKCRQPADEPRITSCHHVFCHECLISLHREAAVRGEDQAKCPECGDIFSGTTPCVGSAELGTERNGSSQSSKSGKRRRPSKDAEDPLTWIEMDGHLLPSAKTLAVKAQILNWKDEAPQEKIIIFTQFHNMIRILIRICKEEGWGYCEYHGRMSLDARDAAISSFEHDDEKGILVASLKCGGIGLNLTCATRVLNVDLWWNNSVEQQAFCRVFRIGQKSPTFIQRFVVRGTVDEKMLAMQKRKDEIIKRALGDDGKKSGALSVPELLSLFGRVETDEKGKPFIWPDEEKSDQSGDEQDPVAGFHD